MSVQEGVAAAQESIDQVAAAANQRWLMLAIRCLKSLSFRQDEIVSDDVWELMERVFPNVTTHEPRAMGPVFQHGKRAGWIVATGRYELTARAQGHARPCRVWSVVND